MPSDTPAARAAAGGRAGAAYSAATRQVQAACPPVVRVAARATLCIHDGSGAGIQEQQVQRGWAAGSAGGGHGRCGPRRKSFRLQSLSTVCAVPGRCVALLVSHGSLDELMNAACLPFRPACGMLAFRPCTCQPWGCSPPRRAGAHQKQYAWDARQGRLRALEPEDWEEGEEAARTLRGRLRRAAHDLRSAFFPHPDEVSPGGRAARGRQGCCCTQRCSSAKLAGLWGRPSSLACALLPWCGWQGGPQSLRACRERGQRRSISIQQVRPGCPARLPRRLLGLCQVPRLPPPLLLHVLHLCHTGGGPILALPCPLPPPALFVCDTVGQGMAVCV